MNIQNNGSIYRVFVPSLIKMNSMFRCWKYIVLINLQILCMFPILFTEKYNSTLFCTNNINLISGSALVWNLPTLVQLTWWVESSSTWCVQNASYSSKRRCVTAVTGLDDVYGIVSNEELSLKTLYLGLGNEYHQVTVINLVLRSSYNNLIHI